MTKGMYPMGTNIVRLAADKNDEEVESNGGLKESLDQITPLEKIVKALTTVAETHEGTAWNDLKTGAAELLDKAMEAQEQVLEQTRQSLKQRREQGQPLVPTPGMISGTEEIPDDAELGSEGTPVVQRPENTRLP